MFVACSTRCFTQWPLEAATRRIADLEFGKFELALDQNGSHLRPCDVASDLETAVARIRTGPGLICSAIEADFGRVDLKTERKRFEAVGRMAKALTVAVLTIPSSPSTTSLDEEIGRLGELTSWANREGLVVTVLTGRGTLAGNPKTAALLCREVPGLGLTLDPSVYLVEGYSNFDEVYPYVQNVHLRDTGRKPEEFQVRIGQGRIEYGRILTQLERHGYQRGLTICIRDDWNPAFDVLVEVRKLKLLLESLL
ncbi:Xylose isomerase domain-containing protein TIM barrel [Isosphaera pallida ATCC 43644]|uniref:Xylose isomerase domain-containing protein TIM barrel n=1 Tax=Isosphaera pallida (strain ATCC 43644 / DSM 9630 / IS1B) TaxID=575540 RepID=E8QXA8_ISOPI|nr:sugar phosphate isomerase/epimerase [Isosphaera pallida]ADV61949.1 Xylose isomerase domain-containing protein TIM barrel [Isosphaera pallida ATCC 43644]